MATKKDNKKKETKPKPKQKDTMKQKQKQIQSITVNINKSRSVSKSKPSAKASPISSSTPYTPITYQYPSYSGLPTTRTISATPISSDVKETVKSTIEPVQETIKANIKLPEEIKKPVPKGRLNIDNTMFSKSKPSIPIISDSPDNPPANIKFNTKPVDQYFKEVTIPAKKDSSVKKVVIGIENRRMGEEDKLSRKTEAIKAQQEKITKFNKEQDDEEFGVMSMLYPIKGSRYDELLPASDFISEIKPKRRYVKSGLYSKENIQMGREDVLARKFENLSFEPIQEE